VSLLMHPVVIILNSNIYGYLSIFESHLWNLALEAKALIQGKEAGWLQGVYHVNIKLAKYKEEKVKVKYTRELKSIGE